MIVVKTRMKLMPETCAKCSYYMRKSDTWYCDHACSAIGGRRGAGKIINIKPCKDRPKWCPLIEI